MKAQLISAAALLYIASTVSAQEPFPAPRTAVNATTGEQIDGVQSIGSCIYTTSNGTSGVPVIDNLFAVQNTSQAVNATSPPSWEVCYIWDPLRGQSPWQGSQFAWPQTFDPDTHVCTATNFLCGIDAPFACGRECFTDTNFTCVVNQTNYFSSYLVPALNCTGDQVVGAVPPQNNATSPGSYPLLFVELVPVDSDEAAQLTSPQTETATTAATATEAPTPLATPLTTAATLPSTSATASIATAAIGTTAPVTAAASTSTASSAGTPDVVPSFDTLQPTAAARAGANKLLHRLSRFF